MEAGRLRHRVTIQRATEGSADAMGEKALTWAELYTVWAAVMPEASREFYRASQVHAEMTHLISIRYRSGITNSDRLRIGSRYLNIVAIQNVDERNVELRLVCVEEV